MKSYQQPPSAESKKSGRKREGSPYDPYKRKARGKENNPGFNSPGLFSCERPRGRVGLRKRCIEAAVEDALRIFHGTRRGENCDKNLWANFAWKCGYKLLRELTLQGKAEMDEHRKPIPDSEKPKVLQQLITPFWKRWLRQQKKQKDEVKVVGEGERRTDKNFNGGEK